MAGNRSSGRRRKPSHTQERDGAYQINPQRRPKGEPEADLLEPEMPADLVGDAAIAWNEMTGYIRKMGILSKSDTHILGMYCRAYGDYMKCQRMTDDKGIVSSIKGQLKRNPFDHAKRDYYNLMMRILARFGLSPSDRAGIDMSSAADESQDPFIKLAKIGDDSA